LIRCKSSKFGCNKLTYVDQIVVLVKKKNQVLDKKSWTLIANFIVQSPGDC